MKLEKQKKLEAQGWRIGTVQEFLGLTDEEVAFIELKLALNEHAQSRVCANEPSINPKAFRRKSDFPANPTSLQNSITPTLA